MKIFPGIGQILHALAEILRIRGNCRSIERACRSAADHRKRIAGVTRQKFRNRREHPHLIGGTSAAAGEYQSYTLLHSCITPLLPAPTTARLSAFPRAGHSRSEE